jgi:hypothetical protein
MRQLRVLIVDERTTKGENLARQQMKAPGRKNTPT